MKVAYVAGPYRAATVASVVRNIEAARDVATALWRLGFAVVCPHMNTALLDGTLDDDPVVDSALWLEGDLELLRRCDLLVTVPGWDHSAGARGEVLQAQSDLQPVYHWPEDEAELRACSNRVQISPYRPSRRRYITQSSAT